MKVIWVIMHQEQHLSGIYLSSLLGTLRHILSLSATRCHCRQSCFLANAKVI